MVFELISAALSCSRTRGASCPLSLLSSQRRDRLRRRPLCIPPSTFATASRIRRDRACALPLPIASRMSGSYRGASPRRFAPGARDRRARAAPLRRSILRNPTDGTTCRKRRRRQATSHLVSGPCVQRPAAARTASKALRAAEETPARARPSKDSAYTTSFSQRRRARQGCPLRRRECRGVKRAGRQFYLCARALRWAGVVPPQRDRSVYHNR